MRPNVVFIICDDLAWGDLACHGNPVPTRTPNLDAMHAGSTRLTRMCSGPLCTPARAGILTGRWHLRTRAFDTYCGRATLDPGEPTIARALQAAGYATGCFGKWHLGDNYPSRPCDMGFDESLVHLGGGIGQPGDRYENHERERESYFGPVLVRGGVPEATRGYCTDVITDACLDFLERRAGAAATTPFFAYVGFNAPHTPLQVADEWAEPYRQAGINETHARLYGMVSNIDHNVGRVAAKLDELGLTDSTLVVFTSDHGPCGSAQNPEAPAGERHRWNAGLRGIKGSMYQGGIQVPSFWRWPGQVPAGRDVERLAATVDVLPTLAELCGAGLPEVPVDGVSLATELRGGAAPPVDRAVFMQWHRGDGPVRWRNCAVITQRWKLTRPHEDAADELYDIARDRRETADVAGAHPDVVADLRARYEDWFDDVGTTRGARTFDATTVPLGTPHENPVLLTQNDWRLVGGGEGWRDDRLRGTWKVRVDDAAARFTVRLRFRADCPTGTAHLALDDDEWTAPLTAGQHVCELPGLALPVGVSRLEAWLHTDAPTQGARHGCFVPALYVEAERTA